MTMSAIDSTQDTVLARLASIEAGVASMLERQRRQDEMLDELRPMMSVAMRSVTQRLDEFERKGHAEFLRELSAVGQRVLESYSADDVRQFGDAIIGILDTVRAMTQPEVLSVLGEAAGTLAHAEKAEALGLVGMVRASGNTDVQRGMGVLMELLKKVGQGASAARRSGAPVKRLEARISPRATAGALASTAPKSRAAACGTMKAAAPAAEVVSIDGVAFTPDGHLADPSAWTRPLGERLAATLGVQLTEAHWKVLEFARKDWEATGSAPNIRRITTSIDVTTKELYALFPKAPGRTVAKIAGIPKPAGCL